MRNIQVNMQFNADTSHAQSQIQQLQSTLNSIATAHVNVQGGSIDQAVQSAKMLNQHLTAATNVKTGKIDFSKLQASLKSANTNLTTLTNNLLAMGPKGQQAFSQVANAVARADLSIKKTNGALAAFGTTLMNTIKWQAASTMIHGVMSAFSAAVSHIENLDKALNNIQIVTGKTSAEMATFAKKAQDLSKALSSTTEEYAKASLIFYQQGLGEREVLERTEATIKMAKVTGEAVQTVSDQLTAIWNNFDNGTKSLEHYVDVITALGAATASSTSEISDGLQKFAAIAETVGLSYEYAATALATVTAETRQSADVVGTAFKTLFARMEGLKLGDTLDDGTTLNQYSQAMAKVGINIKDANGNLKDMDIILDEMGKKWQALNKDQQVALAQQVGGIRQYNQLIALMDNWDTFKINLEIAEDSEGTLEKQFQIYQTSVEASKKALDNTKQTLYETLFNSKALTDFNNGLAKILEVITRVVEKAGGLKGLLQFGGLLILQTLLPKLETFIARITTNVSTVIGLTKNNLIKETGRMSDIERSKAGMQPQEKKGFSMASPVLPTTLRVKQENLPNQQVDASAPAGDMASQISKESAGYTSAILAAKKDYLIIEDQLTAKQREQYKNYEDQVNAAKTLLDLAREKQMLAKQEADKSSQTAQAALRGVATEEQIQETEKKEINKQLVNTGAYARKQVADQRYTQAQAQLKAEEEEIEKERARINSGNLSSQSKKAAQSKLKTREEKFSQNKAQTEKFHKQAEDEYNKERRDAEDRVLSDPNIVKKVDFKGEKTAQLSQTLNSEASRISQIRNEQTQNVEMVKGATSTAMQGLQQELDVNASGNVETSQANLEKLGTLQGQYNAGAQKAVDLQTELGTAINVTQGNVKKGTKEYDMVNKSLKEAGTFAKQYSKEINAAADEMQASGKYSDEQVKAVRKLAKEGSNINLGDMNPKQLEGIKVAMGKVEGGLKQAGATAGNMATGMAEDLAKASNASKDTFVNASNGTRNLATESNNAAVAVKNLQGTIENAGKPVVLPDPFGALRSGIATTTQMMTGLAMGATMLSNGLKSAFDPNATGIERLMGMMMLMQGVQSLLTAGQAAYNIALGIGQTIETLIIAVKEKGFMVWIKEGLLKAKDTIATMANAVASVFAAEAKHGLAGVIAGALAAALIVGTVLMVANTAATEKETKASQNAAKEKEQLAEDAKAAADAAREEMNAAIELMNAYEDLLEVYEETGEGKADLIDKAYETVTALGVENGELLIQQGHYIELAKRIREAAAAKAGLAVTEAKGAVGSSGEAFLAKENVSGTGGTWTTNQSGKSWQEGDGQKYLSLSLGDSGADEKALSEWWELNKGSTPWVINGNLLQAPYNNGGDMGYLLSKLKELREGVAAYAAANKMDTGGQEFFTEIAEMDESGAWDLLEETAGAYDSATETNIEAAKTKMLGDVDSQADYNRVYESMVDEALKNAGATRDSLEGQEIIKKINDNMSKDENYKNYHLNYTALNQLTASGTQSAQDFVGVKDKDGKTALDKWAATNGYADEDGYATDEAYDLFFKINPQYQGDEAGIIDALDRAQGILNGNELQVQYDFMSGAKKALKENMSTQDWQQFLTQNGELFDPKSKHYIGMSFEDFVNKSYSKQQDILSSFQGDPTQGAQMQVDAQQKQVDYAKSEEGEKDFWEGEKARTEAFWTDERAAKAKEKTGREYTSKDVYGDNWYKTDENGEKVYFNRDNYAAGSDEMKAAMDERAAIFGYENAEEWFTDRDAYKTAHNYEGYGELRDAKYQEYVNEQETSLQGYKDAAILQNVEKTNADIEAYDLDSEEVYNMAEALSEMAESNEDVADSLKHDSQAAKLASVEIARFNKAVDAIDDSYDDWMKGLKSDNLSDVIATTNELQGVYADLLNMDATDFTDDFLRDTENLALAQKAAAGDADAYNQLQARSLAEIGKKYGDYANGVVGSLQQIAAMEGIDVGEKLTYTEAEDDLATRIAMDYQRAYDAAIEGGASVAEAKEYAASMINQAGFNITSFGEDMEERTVTVTGDLPEGWEPQENGEINGPDGQPIKGVKWTAKEGGKYTYTQTYMVPKGMTFQKTSETYGGKSSKKSGGGGGDKKKAETVKKSDVVDRYKEINDSIDNISREMDTASKAADRLYGKARLDKMREANKLLEEDIKLTKQKRKEAEAYLQEDKTALEEAMANAGVTFEFDSETGDITNYTDVMTQLHDQLMAEINAANKDGNVDEKEQKAIDAIQEKIDKLKEATEDYEETKETIQDLAQEEIDKFNEWQDNNYELLNIELELKIKVNDRDLERLEYYMKKLEGDLYQRAEAGALLGEKAGTYQKQLGDRGDQYEKIMAQWMNKKISDADAMAALEEQLSGIYNDLSSLQETDTEMMNFYGESIALAQEEMSKFTDQMDHQASVLDHYQNILALTGQEFDYESMGVVLEGQAKMAENGMKAAKAEFDFYKKQAEDKKDLYEQALAEGNTAAAELYKKEYEDALAAANEAEEKFLSAAEDTAEKLKAVLENAMKGFAKDLETALTGGSTFENLTTQMERAASLQEEYLTTTNKIYETNKVMRKAQQEIDKTTNAMAKRKLKSFIQETQQLQDQSKLSKFELEIQQAKYDLLLAEIALEEAQNAKSTVRLQRDSEGNFGYVYTADLSATEDAAQNFADKQNELYNIGLEGANNYKEKYIQTLGEMNDALVELAEKRANGEFATEQEYQEQVLATKEFYYQKLKDYSNLYTTAVGVDAQIVTDSWATQFDTIKLSAEDLEAQVNEYLGNVNTAFNDYNSGLQQITDLTIGPTNLEDLTNKTSALVNENDKLLLAIAGEDGKGGLIGAMDEEFKAISSVTGAWATQRKEVIALIEQYEKLALGIEKVLDKKSPGGSDDEDTDESKTTPDSSEKKEEEKQESTGSEKSEEKQDTPPPKPSESEIQYGTWERVLEVFNNINSGKWPGSLKDRIKTGTAEGYTEEEVKYGQWLIDLTYPTNLGGKGYSRDKAKQIMGFDTGGYTGEWSGSYGKMALLHQKELVLNPQDTENLLTSMNVLDKIVSIIDLYSMNAQMTSSLSSPMFGEMQKADTLEQQVHIEAHFPNVSQHSEIEEAFSNLINTASQYANRR